MVYTYNKHIECLNLSSNHFIDDHTLYIESIVEYRKSDKKINNLITYFHIINTALYVYDLLLSGENVADYSAKQRELHLQRRLDNVHQLGVVIQELAQLLMNVARVVHLCFDDRDGTAVDPCAAGSRRRCCSCCRWSALGLFSGGGHHLPGGVLRVEGAERELRRRGRGPQGLGVLFGGTAGRWF